MEAFLTSIGDAASTSWQFIGGGVQIVAEGLGAAGTTLVGASSKLGAGLIEGIQNIFLLVQ